MKDIFKGMSESESRDLQIRKWTDGVPVHNTVNDECCPDFSCCGGDLAPEDVRNRFAKAYEHMDFATMWAISNIGLSALFAKSGKILVIPGESQTRH